MDTPFHKRYFDGVRFLGLNGKMAKNLLYIFLFLIATQAATQTAVLSSRTFLIGENVATLEDHRPFIVLNEIDWLNEIMARDKVLKGAVFHIEEIAVPISRSWAALPEENGKILLGPDRLPSEFDLPDFKIYGHPAPTATRFTYIPSGKETGFFVSCGQNTRREGNTMLLCVVRASYGPDNLIGLKSRLYFPPNPADAPTYFRDVVRRMRAVARCIDVTERTIVTLSEAPELAKCIVNSE